MQVRVLPKFLVAREDVCGLDGGRGRVLLEDLNLSTCKRVHHSLNCFLWQLRHCNEVLVGEESWGGGDGDGTRKGEE